MNHNFNLVDKGTCLISDRMALVRRGATCLRNSMKLQHIRTFIPTPEHEALRENLWKLIDKEINPRCAQWEKEKKFPAHEVFKILGLFYKFQQVVLHSNKT